MKPNNSTSLLTDDRFHLGMPVRRGLTLTEILAATFVLSFGLVAALAVLPFATHLLSRMDIADSSGACGRGGLQQIRMAEWQKPEALHDIWPGREDGAPDGVVPVDPYIVDPLGYLARGGTWSTFPLSNPTMAEALYSWTLEDIAGLSPPVDEVTANRHFRWNDDMVFTEDAASSRPVLVSITDPVKQSAGDYTWMYMVTPKVDVLDNAERSDRSDFAVTTADKITGYEVAAVVFHRRDLYHDATAGAYQPIRRFELTNFHHGLNTSVDTINETGAYITLRTTSENPDDIALGSIKWILLTGRSQELHDSIKANPTAGPLSGTLVAQWYRITGFDDIVPSSSGAGYERRVFLVGPDWKGAKDSNSSTSSRPLVYAILCDGVVNVFQTTMPK